MRATAATIVRRVLDATGRSSPSRSIRKNSPMSVASPENTVLRVSSTGKEPVVLSVEGGETVTIRIEVESNCTCQAAPRPGSYTDSGPGLA